MTEFVPRSGWADSDWSRGGAQLTGSKLLGCSNHWPGTATSAYGVESRSKVRARIRGWWSYHVNGRNWSDIGYNVAFDQAGRVWDLRGIGRVGAHSASASNRDANHEWVGCLFVLGANEKPTLAMIAAYQEWRYDVFLRRWPGRTDMTGHGRAPGVPGAQTACPGLHVAVLINDGTLKQRPEDDMSWNEDLSPVSSYEKDIIPESWADSAGRQLIKASGALAFQKETEFTKPYFPDERPITQINMHRFNHSRLKRGEDTWERSEAKLDAILDAFDGLDSESIKQRIDQRADEAAQHRQALADESRAAILDAIADVDAGNTSPEEFVRRVGELLSDSGGSLPSPHSEDD